MVCTREWVVTYGAGCCSLLLRRRKTGIRHETVIIHRSQPILVAGNLWSWGNFQCFFYFIDTIQLVFFLKYLMAALKGFLIKI